MMKRPFAIWLLAAQLIGVFAGVAMAQQVASPDYTDPVRGFQPGAAYSLDGIEAINQVNGNVLLTIPLAKFYAGPAQFPLSSLNLYYNSALYIAGHHTLTKWVQPPTPPTGTTYDWTSVALSPQGGWNYGSSFIIEETERPVADQGTPSPPSQQWCWQHVYIYKVYISMPDGSKHELKPAAFASAESPDTYGYSQIDPSGQQNIPSGCTETAITVPAQLVYYSIDGSFLRLVVQTGSHWQYNWTLYFPDGSNVTTTTGSQTITDRNGNTLTITSTTGTTPETTYKDNFGRTVQIAFRTTLPGTDQITVTGPGSSAAGTPLITSVHWKAIAAPTQEYTCGDQTNTGCGDTIPGQTQSVDQILLPSQAGSLNPTAQVVAPLSYSFTYNTENGNDGLGEIASVTLPSTASVVYTYSGNGKAGPFSADVIATDTVLTKTVNWLSEYDGTTSAQSEVWNYNFTFTGSTITAPDGGKTTNSFYSLPEYAQPIPFFSGLIYKTVYDDGSTDETVWQQNIPAVAPSVDQTGGLATITWNPYRTYKISSSANSSKAPTVVKAQQYTNDKNGNVTSTQEYDWQTYGSPPISRTGGIATGISGSVARSKTDTICAATPDASTSSSSGNEYYASSPPNMRNTVCAIDASYGGAEASRTERSYDGNGNLLTEKHWDSTKGGYSNPLTSTNSIAVSHTYGTNGTLGSTTDAIGTVTQYSYGSISGGGSSYSNLCLTQQVAGSGITSLDRTTTFTPDFWTCLSTNTTDVENGNVAATSYDPFGRMKSRTEASGRPEQRTTSVTYQDGCDGNGTSCRYAFVKSDLNSGDGALSSVYRYDQLGRIRLTQKMEAPSATVPAETAGIKVQTRRQFQASGRFQLVSNPFRATISSGATGESTMGWTLTGYDTMGRVNAVRTFGSATAPAFTATTGGSGSTTTVYSATSSTTPMGETTTVTDPQTKARTTTVDGLGRLSEVIEDPNNLKYATTYTYDGLDDLVSVNQSSLTRQFSYDTLGRLSYAINPESGLTCYGNINSSASTLSGACVPANGYDASGNALLKSFKVAKVNNSYTATTETLAYDPLDRLIQETYSDGTAAVAMCYDGNTTASGATASVTCTRATALSNVNARGRLTFSDNGVSANSYSAFDSYGRVLQSTQIIPALATTVNGITTYPTFTYTYNAVGLTKEVYPSGRTVTIGYDGAGREDTIGGTKSYTASAIQYTAHGAITALPLAAVNLTEQTCYSSRLQPFIIRLASATTTNCANSGMDLLNLTYTYGVTQDSTGNVTSGDDNGNVMSQQIARNGQTTVTQSYTGYDGVNRLTGASETSAWSQSYGYDAYGNRWVSANTDFPLTAFTPTASTNFPAGTNQLNVDGSLFDAAGNMTQIGGWMFKYDAENHQTSAAINTTTSTYAYDGEGRRVQKVSGGETTLYVYDAQGDLMAEYEGPSPSQPPLCQTCYVTVDHLGSTRLEIDGVSGQPVAYHDYLPFGEEVTSVTGDTTTQKFTGKERDAETGLDYFGARYMSSAQGRFTSVDPISGTVLHLLNPQRWNMYAYAVNNPLAYTDPDGRDAIAVKFGNLAHDLGHAGVASVHHDGKGTFADFGPQHGGQAHDAGKYDFIDFKTQIQYGADGKPTKASLTALANELADAELQPHDSVSVAYFKTSDSETAALDAYINAAKAQQAGGKTPTYWVGFRDCIWFCTNGMQKAGVGPGSSTLTVPNFQYLSFWLWADQTATGTNPPKEKVTSKICYNDENGKQVCQ